MPIASKLALDVEGFLSLHPDPYLLMPGTQLTIPTGKTGNKVKIEMWASGDVYVVADAITKLIPLAGIPDGEAKFVNDAVDIFRTWKACSSGANTLQKIGCAATAAWEIKTDFERDAAAIAIDFVGGEAKIVKEIYDSFTDIREGTLLNADLGKFNAGAKEIDIAPASSTGSSGTLPSPQVPPGGSASGSSPTVPATGPTPTKPQTTASPRLPVFTVMNTSETPPDGVWFRNSPHTADTSRITGLGVYAGENVRLECFAWGDAVGPYNDRLWYLVADISRATVSGRANSGYLNAHYINDGMVANQVDSGVPQC